MRIMQFSDGLAFFFGLKEDGLRHTQGYYCARQIRTIYQGSFHDALRLYSFVIYQNNKTILFISQDQYSFDDIKRLKKRMANEIDHQLFIVLFLLKLHLITRQMEISVNNQAEAKITIGKLFNQRKLEFEQGESLEISQWLNETHSVRCYMLKEDNLLSFAILSKMDFDPWNKHKDPWTLNFIYTFTKYRKRGYAKKLLTWIKKRQEITAFCSNQQSQRLFDSVKFHRVGEEPIPTYRFP